MRPGSDPTIDERLRAHYAHLRDDPPTEPLPSELVETIETRLVQIEVTVHGPPEVVSELTPADFKLKIKDPLIGPIHTDARRIRDFL